MAKFALVVLLTGYHHALGIWRKDFADDATPRDQVLPDHQRGADAC